MLLVIIVSIVSDYAISHCSYNTYIYQKVFLNSCVGRRVTARRAIVKQALRTTIPSLLFMDYTSLTADLKRDVARPLTTTLY